MIPKVLVVTSLYPSDSEPQKAPFNFETIKALSQLVDLQVVSPRPWWTRIRTPSQILRSPRTCYAGIPAVYPSYWSLPSITRMHGKALSRSMSPLVRRIRREFPFNVVFGTWAYPDMVAAARIARDAGCPFIAKVHGSDINEFAESADMREQISCALKQADRVIAVSAALGDKVCGLGVNRDSVRVQHNAVDGDRFFIRNREETRAKLGLAGTRKLLLYVGRLSKEKGVDILLNAMESPGMEDIDVVIVGHGAESDSLLAQHGRLGLGEHVRFVGTKLPAEIPDWITASDALCLPSRREGCPNVILEALASGRPVVAARVGGVPELLTEANGVMVEPEDPGALAKGIRDVLDRAWQPEALRQTVRYLSWGDVAKSIFAEITAIIPARRGTVGQGLNPR